MSTDNVTSTRAERVRTSLLHFGCGLLFFAALIFSAAAPQ